MVTNDTKLFEAAGKPRVTKLSRRAFVLSILLAFWQPCVPGCARFSKDLRQTFTQLTLGPPDHAYLAEEKLLRIPGAPTKDEFGSDVLW